MGAAFVAVPLICPFARVGVSRTYFTTYFTTFALAFITAVKAANWQTFSAAIKTACFKAILPTIEATDLLAYIAAFKTAFIPTIWSPKWTTVKSAIEAAN